MNKKSLMYAALAALMALSPLKSYAAEAANTSPIPKGWAGITEVLTFQGTKTERIVASAASTLLHAGPGFLDEICSFGGSLGNYSLAYDTADGSSMASGLTTTAALTYAISPKVYTLADSTSLASFASWNASCWQPTQPIKFVIGLYGQQNASGPTTIFHGHCSDGSNPCVF